MAYRRMAGGPPGTKTYIRKYSQFRGVDFANDPTQVDESRSPWAVNMISDLSGFPEKRKGWKVLCDLKMSGRVNGLFCFVDEEEKKHFLAHVGTDLYDWSDHEPPYEPYVIYTEMNDARSTSFVHGGKLYILDGANYLVYDGRAVGDACAGSFIPTTRMASTPSGAGESFEAVNYLQPKQINSFAGNGTDKAYKLSATELDDDPVTAVVTQVVNGIITDVALEEGKDFTVDRAAGTVTFHTAPPVSPSKAGVDNVYITFAKTQELKKSQLVFSGNGSQKEFDLTGLQLRFDKVTARVGGAVKMEGRDFALNRAARKLTFHTAPPAGTDNVVVIQWHNGYGDRIKKCTIATQFGYGNANRIFLSGNPDLPNWDFQSGLDDPTYFPDTGYTRIGSEATAIMGYLKQYDNLLIIKEDNDQDTGIFLRTAGITEDGRVYFPLKGGVAGVGAISKMSFATLRDDPLFLSRQGVNAVSLAGSVTQERKSSRKAAEQARSEAESARAEAELSRQAGFEAAVSDCEAAVRAADEAARRANEAALNNGDMVRAVYDTDGDGKVDAAQWADAVPWDGVRDKPQVYPPAAHGHGVGEISGAAPLNSPALTGVPTAPTAAKGTSTGQIATTAFVAQALEGFNAGGTWGSITGNLSDQTDLSSALAGKAPLNSPALTGVPTAPTAAKGTSTGQIATTAFVASALPVIVKGGGTFNSTNGVTITHNLGTTDYRVAITVVGSAGSTYIGEVYVVKSSNTMTVYCTGTATNAQFDYLIIK